LFLGTTDDRVFFSPSVVRAGAAMAYLGQWAEHVWTRMRRLDYWNKEHVINNLPAKVYRRVSPGSQPPAEIPRKTEDAVYSIRYFQRDAKRRDTGYYPDTPLSLNHNLMKGRAIRCDLASPPGAQRGTDSMGPCLRRSPC